MSRRRAIALVARREFLERGRSRAFLLALAVTLGFLLLGVFVPSLVGDGGERLGLVGAPPEFRVGLTTAARAQGLDVEIRDVPDVAAAETALREERLDAAFVAPAGDDTGQYVVRERGGGLSATVLMQLVGAAWSQHRLTELLGEAGVSQQEFQLAARPPTVRELVPADPNRDTSFLFANVGVILLFVAIFTFGTWVLSGVVEEKQSRVVEVVLSTVDARDLLVGKVLGIGLLGLVQLVIMVVVGLGAALWAGRITLPPTTFGAVAQLLLWFVLGYTFYSTALGVLGALASRMEDASNASSPVTFVAMGGYLFSLLVALDAPSGLPARVASLIPPIAPMVVPLRAALGAIEPWEILLSVATMLGAIAALFVFGGRVYAGAVLRTGSRMRLRDAWRAARD